MVRGFFALLDSVFQMERHKGHIFDYFLFFRNYPKPLFEVNYLKKYIAHRKTKLALPGNYIVRVSYHRAKSSGVLGSEKSCLKNGLRVMGENYVLLRAQVLRGPRQKFFFSNYWK